MVEFIGLHRAALDDRSEPNSSVSGLCPTLSSPCMLPESISEQAKELSRCFSEVTVQMAGKYMKRFLPLQPPEKFKSKLP